MEAESKRNCDPRHWEPFDREIEASLIKIFGLKWVEERMCMGGDRLWRLKGKWARERSVYAGAATGKIELDILFPAGQSGIDKDGTKDQIAARVTRWLKSVPKEAALPQKRWLSIRSQC